MASYLLLRGHSYERVEVVRRRTRVEVEALGGEAERCGLVAHDCRLGCAIGGQLELEFREPSGDLGRLGGRAA